MTPLRLSLALLIGLLAAIAQASEEMPAHSVYLGAHVSQYFYDVGDAISGNPVDDTTLPGIQVGYRLSDSWSLQGWWERNSYRREKPGSGGDLNIWLGSLRYHWTGTDVLGFAPYAGLSAGETLLESIRHHDASLVGVEFGLQRRIQPHWVLDLGIRPLYTIDNERWDLEPYLALNYLFSDGNN